MEYNRREIILDFSFGNTLGEAWTLANILSNPHLDLKLIIIEGDQQEKQLRLLSSFLSTVHRKDIPVALGESPIPMNFESALTPGYSGKVFSSSFDACAAILPRMRRPEILCLSNLSTLLGIRPFLHQFRVSILLTSQVVKGQNREGQYIVFDEKEFFYDPDLDIVLFSAHADEKLSFSPEIIGAVYSSKTVFGDALANYEWFIPKEQNPSFHGFAASWFFLFPQNFDLDYLTIEGCPSKAITWVKTYHKEKVMKEISVNHLCTNSGDRADLQIVAEPHRFRMSYPSFQPSEKLFVIETGWEHHRPGDHYGPMPRDSFFLHLLVGGKGTLKLGDKVFPLREGDIFVLPANTPARIDADNSDPYEYYWVGFNGEDAKALVDACGFSAENGYIIRVFDAESVKNELRILAEVQSRGIGTSYWLLGHLYIVMSLLAFQHPAPLFEKKDYVKEAIRYMNENFTSPIGINDVCKHISVERTYFFRRFKREMGISPQDYLVSLRINRAKELLKNSTKPISMIGYLVGYPNYISFLKIFTRKTGENPSQYRLSHQKRRQSKEE